MIYIKILGNLKLILFILLLTIIPINKVVAAPEIFGQTGVVINAKTGQVIFDKDKDKKMYPASTTKILTCILALENSNMSDRVIVDEKTPFEVDGGHIALEPGEDLSMEQMIEALMLNSANDAAMVIGRHLGGNLENFSKMMNDKAKQIGANNTHYTNPSGLPDPNHITTAHDLAKMAQYGLRNGAFRYFVTKVEGHIPPTNIKNEERFLLNSNKMLYCDKIINVDGIETPIKYEGITGVKTGYTDEAQNCLVSSALRNDREYISVVLHSNLDHIYIDSHKLLDYAFNKFNSETILKKNQIIDYNNKMNFVIPEDVICDLSNDNLTENSDIFKKYNLKKEFVLNKDKLKDEYSKGDKLGTLKITQNGFEVANTPILANKDNKKTTTQVSNIFKNFSLGRKTSTFSFVFATIMIVAIFMIFILGFIRFVIKKINHRKKSISKN